MHTVSHPVVSLYYILEFSGGPAGLVFPSLKKFCLLKNEGVSPGSGPLGVFVRLT